MRKFQQIFIFIVLLTSTLGYSQNSIPLLDRKISVNLTNVSLKDALFELSKIGSFNLSYNSTTISSNRTVSLSFSQKKISEILPKVLPSDIIFKTSSNSLVLFKNSVKEIKKNDIVIQGNIFDSIAKNYLSKATIVDIYSLQSVLSDSIGNFELRFNPKQQDLLVSVTKLGYRDTTLLLEPKNQTISIKLSKIENPQASVPPNIEPIPIRPIESYPISQFIIPDQLVINAQNITGYSTKKFQLALTPGLSTNLKIAGTVKNDVSINLIGGYSYGTNFFELGGAFNINRTNVNGIQIAGFSNLVGGSVNGWQIVGALNRTKGQQKGVQIAGFGNFNSNTFSGLQLSGAVNISKNVSGVQLAGGINIADSVRGLQITTIINKCAKLKGLQLSAGINLCDTLNGTQIGIINRAKHNNGFQFGVINFINSSEGLSVGILNIIKGKILPRVLVVYRKKTKINIEKQ